MSELKPCDKESAIQRIIQLANNIVAIIHLFQYNKYKLSTFLLEPLAKKVRSISFVSQYSIQDNVNDPNFLHADSEDSDQTGRMPRLI